METILYTPFQFKQRVIVSKVHKFWYWPTCFHNRCCLTHHDL